jgi:hypothetical protein
MPLRRELPPFPFSGSVAGVFGLLLAANRFHVKFFSQAKIRCALICGHSATPRKKAGAQRSQSPVKAECIAAIN